MSSWINCKLGETPWLEEWILGFIPVFVINKSQAYVDFGLLDCTGRIMYCEIEIRNKELLNNLCRKDVYDFLD